MKPTETMENQMTLLFPTYLNQGSKGPAVFVLQLLISVIEGPETEVLADGDFTVGGKTAAWVARFQESQGLDPDGNFGPLTRGAFLGEYGIDVDVLTVEDFTGTTTIPDDEETVTVPEVGDETDTATDATVTDGDPVDPADEVAQV